MWRSEWRCPATPAARANPVDTAETILTTTDGVGLQPGSVVAERYRIVGVLGWGAMGEVYRADDLKVGQRVALRFLPMQFTADASRVNRFVNEVRLARQISHPNVCRVYDIGEADGRHYLSMEFIEPGTALVRINRASVYTSRPHHGMADWSSSTRRGIPFPATHESVWARSAAFQFAFVAMTVAALRGAGFLARWNIRQGRWDRSGALKVAGYVFVMGLFMALLRADHVPIATDEYLIFARLTSWILYSAAFTFLVYVAFEPFVRQRWPRVLTSWSRLLTGRLRDPLVGRDILIGATAGVVVASLREGEFIASRWHLAMG
jgi:hypothetical protein